MKILILKNIEREGPGLIADWLIDHKIDFDTLEVSAELAYQDYLNQYDGLIVLGGPASANDQTPAIKQELDFIHKWLKTEKPYLGVCLGLQLMIKASGGEVVPGHTKEIGFYHLDDQSKSYSVKLNELETNPLKAVLPSEFPVFQLHGETVKHDSIKSLAKSDWCDNQICAVSENQLGVQFHFEVTAQALGEWLAQDPDLASADKEKYLSAYENNKASMQSNCYALMNHVFNK